MAVMSIIAGHPGVRCVPQCFFAGSVVGVVVDAGADARAGAAVTETRSSEGYASSDRGDVVVFVSTVRDTDLIYSGLLRDLARQLQQLRKEKQYNPTETLHAARVAGLSEEDVVALKPMNDRLAFLVRVNDVILSKERIPDVEYKTIDLDGREFHISVD